MQGHGREGKREIVGYALGGRMTKDLVARALFGAVSYHRPPPESFWGTLKNELVNHRRYTTRALATNEITEYIEIFYNRQRRHSKLGSVALAVFAQQWQQRMASTIDDLGQVST